MFQTTPSGGSPDNDSTLYCTGASVAHSVPCVPGTGAGTALLPMHLPVLLCGLLRLAVWSSMWHPGPAALVHPHRMPPHFPDRRFHDGGIVCHAVPHRAFLSDAAPETLCILVGGYAGAAVSFMGLVNAVFMGVAGKPYGFAAFLSGAFLTAWPGILLQLIVVLLLVFYAAKSGLWSRTLRQSE